MIVRALAACHPDCPWCAREWWAWLRGRMASMGRLVDGVSFAEAAASSVRPR